MTDTFVVVKKGKKFYVKNIKTGKVGSNVFYSQANAEIQRKNRERFIKLIQTHYHYPSYNNMISLYTPSQRYW